MERFCPQFQKARADSHPGVDCVWRGRGENRREGGREGEKGRGGGGRRKRRVGGRDGEEKGKRRREGGREGEEKRGYGEEERRRGGEEGEEKRGGKGDEGRDGKERGGEEMERRRGEGGQMGLGLSDSHPLNPHLPYRVVWSSEAFPRSCVNLSHSTAI